MCLVITCQDLPVDTQLMCTHFDELCPDSLELKQEAVAIALCVLATVATYDYLSRLYPYCWKKYKISSNFYSGHFPA